MTSIIDSFVCLFVFRMEGKIGKCVITFISCIALVCIGRCERLVKGLNVQGGQSASFTLWLGNRHLGSFSF